MKIEEIIAKLPKEYQPIARRYVPLLINMGFAELQAWIEMVASGNWQQAYRKLVAKMETDELIADQEKSNEILKALNKENANLVVAQKELVHQIFLSILLMLRGQIE